MALGSPDMIVGMFINCVLGSVGPEIHLDFCEFLFMIETTPQAREQALFMEAFL